MRRPWNAALLVAALAASYLAGSHQDYKNHYLPGWETILGGEDPWSASGGHGFVYAPLFGAFAPLVLVHPLLPKLLFALCWFGLGAWYLDRNADGPLRRGWFYTFWTCSPLFWVEIVHYGHFDMLLAALCVFALVSSEEGREVAAGIGLGAGALLKFYPLVMLPALAVREGRMRWKLFLSCLATLAAGCCVAYGLWGPAFLQSLLAASAKRSTHHSVFRFLRGEFSPTPDLDAYANVTLVGALTIAVLAGWIRRLPPVVHAYLLLMTLFTFYPMSNVQYMLVLIALAPLVVMRHPEALRGARALVALWSIYATWITIYQVLYWLHGDFTAEPWIRMRDIAGAITFPLAMAILWLLLKTSWARSLDSLAVPRHEAAPTPNLTNP